MPEFTEEVRLALANLNLRPEQEASLVEELSQHLRERFEDLKREGLDLAEARRLLSEELRSGQLTRELRAVVQPDQRRAHPDSSEPVRFWRDAGSDLRFGARLLRADKGFAAVAIVSLALGIGANSTIFNLIDAVRLRSLPVHEPQQLASLVLVHGQRTGSRVGRLADFSSAQWREIERRQQGFSQLAAWSPQRLNLGSGGEAQHAQTLFVSGSFFDALQVRPVLGRLISRADDQAGCGSPGAVLSYGFWQQQYGGMAAAIGRKIVIEGRPLEIMGVTPKSFFGVEVGQNFDLAIPVCAEPMITGENPWTYSRMTWWLGIFGRLKPRWTIERASAQLGAVSPAIFSETLPSEYGAETRKSYLAFRLRAAPFATGVSSLRKQTGDPLLILLAISGLVLLIACANLTNLMLARGNARQREMAVRIAMGASQLRLIRQLFAESLLLAFAGAAAGFLLAHWLSRAIVAFLSGEVAIQLATDWRVLSFSAALALLTCFVFGLMPALKAARTDPGTVMKAHSRGTTVARERFFVRRILVASQVGLSLVLLVTALLFVRTFQNLSTVNVGFQQDHLLTADFDFTHLQLPPEARVTYKNRLLAAIRSTPGLRSAASVTNVQLSGNTWNEVISIPEVGVVRKVADFDQVSDGYFRTMGTAMVAGRDFNELDTLNSPLVAIVNEKFVKAFLPSGNPLESSIRVVQYGGKPDRVYRIIGVVRDSKYRSLRDEFAPMTYITENQTQFPDSDLTAAVRFDGEAADVIAALKKVAAETNPAIVLNFSIVELSIQKGLLQERLMAALSGWYGLIAIVLAMTGLYGVISYLVAQRRNEIGIRMALGATRSRILSMMLREAGVLLGFGLIAGVALSIMAGRTAESLLYGLRPTDPSTIGLAVVSMAVAALVASLLPARRAATLDPMDALREE